MGTGNETTLDVAIVGAGFAGLYALHRLRGLGYKCRVFEAGDGVGGTWFWNRYPGAACDIESLEYSYSFSEDLAREWVWSDRFARQPEILAYINHVADRFCLRDDIQLSTRVTVAAFDAGTASWNLGTDAGDALSARFVIMATGCLSAAKPVEYPGLSDFRGQAYSTAHWPKEPVDFTGKRVAVIGTGSSAIQVIPLIAEQAAHLTVFQRTPNFSVPAGNRAISADEQDAVKARYRELRRKERHSDSGVILLLDGDERCGAGLDEAEQIAEFEKRWNAGGLYFYTSFRDLFLDAGLNDKFGEMARGKIREKVKDPVVAELLCPKTYPFATKRLCADTGYFETFNRDNVTLIDLHADPIIEITPDGIRTAGHLHNYDCIVFATGFDAMTGAMLRIDIRGRDGVRLADKWGHGPQTYLGLMTAGFPNLFITTGPQSPSVVYNMVLGNEYHVEWISDCIEHMRREVLDLIDATGPAEATWVATVNAIGNATLFAQANSWYLGANVPGKPRAVLPYLAGFKSYRDKCDEVARNHYDGFAFEVIA